MFALSSLHHYPLRSCGITGAELGRRGGLSESFGVRPEDFVCCPLAERGCEFACMDADSESSESVDEGGLEGFKGGLWFNAASRSALASKSVSASTSLRR